MKKLVNYLQNLGYSDKEAKVYISLLELGEASVLDIAKKSEINRTTVYPIISKLIQGGLVKKMIKKKKKFYYIEDVNDIYNLLKQKERTLEKAIPELRAIHNILPTKPNITYYEGGGGMRQFYIHILNQLSTGDTIKEYVGSHSFKSIMPSEFNDFYPKERVKRKIAIQMIATESNASKKWAQNSENFLRQVKIYKNKLPFSSNIQIYKKGVGIISYTDSFMGIIIESRDVSNMMQDIFDMNWNCIS